MTIMATHFAIVLGAWRLRVRIDVDEPRESELSEPCAQAHPAAPAPAPETLRVPTWGHG
jgi:hypothetical protein